MSNSPDLERIEQYYRLIERMIEEVDKQTLAEAARMLALNVAHYRSKFGELPRLEGQRQYYRTHRNKSLGSQQGFRKCDWRTGYKGLERSARCFRFGYSGNASAKRHLHDLCERYSKSGALML